MSFWQYQIHQEASFQHAVYRNVNEKNAQLQKQLDNVIREANGEISLLNNKITELERDLELERRKAAGLQDSLKDRDKEYQKLKAQYDKIKRKALLAPNVVGGENARPGTANDAHLGERHVLNDQANRLRPGAMFGPGLAAVDMGAVVGDMEAHGIQRTPIVNRAAGASGIQSGSAWRQPGVAQRHQPQRQPFSANAVSAERAFRTSTTTPDSVTSVENLLGGSGRSSGRPANNLHAWPAPQARGSGGPRPVQRGKSSPPAPCVLTHVREVFGQSSARRSSGFKPSPVLR
ncbi:hypothetical protein FOMPIDRAFT_1120485 [Fomitopsis schrenkii]|uniref:Uncharacterized protein n=1 Tax=Fomitopsis schrenkii TaxID=2126942 RepID=S8E8V7_FOMSC|nr:hypothetical protein FOMPIDRAFT_1120485 [Fomitopsis schrenkii]